MHLGEVISSYRKAHQLSMDGFAAQSGLSKAYISVLERNKTPRGGEPAPSIETYRAVAKAVCMDVDELIRMVDGKIALVPTAEGVQDSSITELPVFANTQSSSTEKLEKKHLQAAFWGGEKDLDQEDLDAMWDDVKQFATFLAEKKRQEKQNND